MQNPEMNDEQLQEAIDEAAIPELSKDEVTFGYGENAKTVKVMYPNLKIEKQLIKWIAPYAYLLGELEKGGLETIGKILDQMADVLPKCVAIAFERQGITLEWLEENSDTTQILAAINAQMGKIRGADLLGKLLPLVAQKG